MEDILRHLPGGASIISARIVRRRTISLRTKALGIVEPSSFDLWIFRSLRRIMRAVDVHSRRLAAEFMVTGPQLLCLQTLHDDGPLTTSALAKLIHLSKSTTVGILDRLEQKGWVSRERSNLDRRVVLVHITADGEACLAAAPSLLQGRLAQGLRNLPEKEQLVIAQSLERVVEMLETRPDVAPLLEAGPIIEDQIEGSTEAQVRKDLTDPQQAPEKER